MQSTQSAINISTDLLLGAAGCGAWGGPKVGQVSEFLSLELTSKAPKTHPWRLSATSSIKDKLAQAWKDLRTRMWFGGSANLKKSCLEVFIAVGVEKSSIESLRGVSVS